MTSENEKCSFSDDQRRQFCSLLLVGCDRQTACNYVGKTALELRSELEGSEAFREQVLHAEATAEFNHMRNLYNASKDEKHWRASVWWLERQLPERYGRRPAGSPSVTQLRQFVEDLADAIVQQVANTDDRRRLLARLTEITEALQSESIDHQPLDSVSIDGGQSLRIVHDPEEGSAE